MDFIEGRFADAKQERPFFFEADIGSSLDKLRGNAVGDAGQSSHAAGHDHHGVRGIRAAGNVGSDIGIRLLMNFRGGLRRITAEDLSDKIAAAAQPEFLGDNAQSAVRGDEINVFDAPVAFDRLQKMAEE
jgi:hypothetical protein